MLEIGKLYVCEEYYLILYPDKETAAATAAEASTFVAGAVFAVCTAAEATPPAAAVAAYWTRKLGKPVSYADKNTVILVLNNKEGYIEVLAGDKKVWIIFKDWLNIKEIK